MCLSHIVLALWKFIEFYERYHNALSAEHRATAKALIREINRRRVSEIRNKFVGHMWDNILGRPLMHSEIMSRLTGMAEGDLLGFLEWINNPKANTYPVTVVSVVETIRDAIVAERSIDRREILNR